AGRIAARLTDHAGTAASTAARLTDHAGAGAATSAPGAGPASASGSASAGSTSTVASTALAGRGRRPGHLALVEPAPPHLILAPGPLDTPQLYTDGFILEGALRVSYSPDTDRLRLSCARARELKAGNETGRIYPDVDLVGSLSALLGAIDAIAREPTTFAAPTPP